MSEQNKNKDKGNEQSGSVRIERIKEAVNGNRIEYSDSSKGTTVMVDRPRPQPPVKEQNTDKS